MKLTSLTVFIFALSGFAIRQIWLGLKKERIGFRSALMWILLWASIGMSSVFPFITDYFAQLAQMQNKMFFVLLVAEVIIFALLFNLATNIERLKRDMTRIVQEMALTPNGDSHERQKNPGEDVLPKK